MSHKVAYTSIKGTYFYMNSLEAINTIDMFQIMARYKTFIPVLALVA